jgi:integrase
MAWIKKPYTTRAGRRYAVGYTDADGVERTRGGFTTRDDARDWRNKIDAAAAHGRDALKEFLDRSLGNGSAAVEELTIAGAFSLWWARDADPERAGGLAPKTASRYLEIWNTHVQPRIGAAPLAEFARPGPCARLLGDLRDSGAGDATVKLARTVVSSMLSWAVEQEYVEDNGVRRIQRRRRRSSRGGRPARSGAATQTPQSPRAERQGRALSPRAVAAIYRAQLADPHYRGLRRERDATATLTQYLLGCRNQELWGLRWEDVGPHTTSFLEVVSYGALDEGKTSGSRRHMPTPALLREILDAWRAALTAAGRPPQPADFIFAGAHERGHMTADQARLWPRRYFVPVCEALAGDSPKALADQERFKHVDRSLEYLRRSTQYSLRRGHMSVRLRAGEDSAIIAKQCGTSVQMLYRHYADDIAEAGVDPRPLEEQLCETLANALGGAQLLERPRQRCDHRSSGDGPR